MLSESSGLLAQRPHLRPALLRIEELIRHRAFAATLGAAPVWDAYLHAQPPAGQNKLA